LLVLPIPGSPVSCGTVAVSVETNGKTIIRARDKKENLYQLDAEEYRAFGTAVPDEIQAAFGFSDVNLQGQMDAPFLLSSSAGEVARYLNNVMGLDLSPTMIAQAKDRQYPAPKVFLAQQKVMPLWTGNRSRWYGAEDVVLENYRPGPRIKLEVAV